MAEFSEEKSEIDELREHIISKGNGAATKPKTSGNSAVIYVGNEGQSFEIDLTILESEAVQQVLKSIDPADTEAVVALYRDIADGKYSPEIEIATKNTASMEVKKSSSTKRKRRSKSTVLADELSQRVADLEKELANNTTATKPAALEPEVEVYFNFDTLGSIAARYHQVIDTPECFVLVYDTAYTKGYQYLPPTNPDVSILLSIPSMRIDNLSCVSLGLKWDFNGFDMVVLMKN